MPDTLQQPPSAKPEPTLSMQSQSRRILFIEFGFCAAVALCLTAMMLGPDGTLDPGALAAWSGGQPTWARGLRAAILLAFLAVGFDFSGRLLAFPVARIDFARTVTWRRLAAIRLAILSALLAWTGLNIVFGSWPAPHGWARPVFFGVLFVPIVPSVVEWSRSRS